MDVRRIPQARRKRDLGGCQGLKSGEAYSIAQIVPFGRCRRVCLIVTLCRPFLSTACPLTATSCHCTPVLSWNLLEKKILACVQEVSKRGAVIKRSRREGS